MSASTPAIGAWQPSVNIGPWQADATEQTATPVMDKASGAYAAGTTVGITCDTPSSTIYYTTDGSPPDSGSSVYATPIAISDGMNIKAFATAAGYDDSEIASETYTILVASAQPIITIIT